MPQNVRPEASQHTKHLAQHHRLLNAVFDFFIEVAGIEGAFVSGSTASGGMDEWSDLDLGFLTKDTEAREKIWNARWDWRIAPWFHRFDVDGIKPYFVVYFFEPSVHVDLNFYVSHDLPTTIGAPFVVAWDKTNTLDNWASKVNEIARDSVDWGGAIHDDERFWAWTHYCASHALRGELYDATCFIKDIRKIVEDWEARLKGFASFSSRRAESRFDSLFLEQLNDTFCRPDRASIHKAFRSLIAIQLRQRGEIAAKTGIRWKTSGHAVAKVSAMIDGL